MDFALGTPGVGRAYLKAGGEDEAVELVLHPVDDGPPLGYPLDPLAPGVDQGHVGPVEGGQILVVESGTLAAVRVVGLECSGRLRVLDDRIHPGPDLFHDAEVGVQLPLNHLGR